MWCLPVVIILALIPKEPVNDKRARGVAQMMVDAQKYFDNPLSQKVLFSWHTLLMKGSPGIQAGAWRPLRANAGGLWCPGKRGSSLRGSAIFTGY